MSGVDVKLWGDWVLHVSHYRTTDESSINRASNRSILSKQNVLVRENYLYFVVDIDERYYF